MKIHRQLSLVVGWVGFSLGWMVAAGGLGPGSGWIALANGILMKSNYSIFTHKICLLFLIFNFNLFIFSHFFYSIINIESFFLNSQSQPMRVIALDLKLGR